MYNLLSMVDLCLFLFNVYEFGISQMRCHPNRHINDVQYSCYMALMKSCLSFTANMNDET